MDTPSEASDSTGFGAVKSSKPYHQAEKFSHVSIDHAANALTAQNQPQRFRIPISDHDDTAEASGPAKLKSALSSPRSSVSSATAVRRGAWKATGKPSGSASRIHTMRATQSRSSSSSSRALDDSDFGSPTDDHANADLDQNPHGLDVADHPAWHRVKERSGSTAPGTLHYLPAVGNSKASGSSLDDDDNDFRQQDATGILDPGWNASAQASSSQAAANEVEMQGQFAGDYDWANFIFAYSRGRWNPGLIPQPPGQSTVFPGAKVKVNTIPLAPGQAETSVSHARRPSLEYTPLPGQTATPDSAPIAVPTEQTACTDLQNVDEEAVADQAIDRLHDNSSLPELSKDAVHAHSSSQSPFKPTTAFNTNVFAALRPPSSSMSAVTQLPTSNEPQDTVVPEGHIPQRAQTVPDALPSRKDPGDIPQQRMGPAPPAADPNQPKSDPVAGPTVVPSASGTSPHTLPADLSERTNVTPSKKKATFQDLRRPSIPQHISHLDLNPSPLSSPISSKKRTSTSDIATAKDKQPEVETPHRPGPTPVQRSDSDGSHPAVWQSAPEGLSAFAEAMARQASGSAATHYGNYGIEHFVDNNIVAGLRRAARRTSIEKEHTVISEAGKIAKLVNVPHSASFPGSSPRPSFSAAGPRDGVQPLSHLSSGRISVSSQGASLNSNPTVSVAHFVGGKPSGETRIDLRGTVTSSPASGNDQAEVQPLIYPGGETDSRDVSLAAQASMRPHAPPPSSSARRVNDYLAEGRRVELFYRDNGYLPAILPPQERQRLHALARYGPPKIAGDANFERIAHLVKLVFSSKLVLITLVGENQQIFQTQMGGGGKVTTSYLQGVAGSRNCSFCSHAILQDSDEPIVILDAPKDWRFSGNPLVQGTPDIRFYAGSPLRTPDGFNIGSLCIIDDKPRTEFGPRLRHTLKEFARVVMREMELLRDRIQLGVRDRMQRSVEMFTKECLEMDSEEADSDSVATPQGQVGAHKVFDLAAKSMREALQVTGAVIFDLSHFELIDSYQSDFAPSDLGAGTSSKVYFSNPQSSRDDATPGTRATDAALGRSSSFTAFDGTQGVETANSPFGSPSVEQSVQARRVPPMNVLGSSENAAVPLDRNDPVPLSHHVQVAEFLRLNRTGKFYPYAPPPFRSLLPHGVNSLLLVPIFGLNKQPFALLCAYIAGAGESIGLEELQVSGLQYIRALGMIVLSATLKKDIMLADRAKSNFISNISHELRTPLHGILAAAELLNETKINATQGSYLETVEACGKSLLELVNHVLDFTKLSGNTRQGSKNGQAKTPCDMVKLIQEVCESSWIGQMAKRLESSHTGIGSVYAPPSGASGQDNAVQARAKVVRENKVETVIDIAMRSDGWLVNCDIGGIRRVLMNLIGNSLKFTSEGYVHVSLREVQSSDTHIMIELSVTDTGLGISRAFLEEQLFHPFTQENPHGTGTGLGLSIVNSIVQSPALNGKIDVWSTEGEGTEIRVTCELEICQEDDFEGAVYKPALSIDHKYKVAFLGFSDSRGDQDLETALKGYFQVWWEFEFVAQSTPTVPAYGDIVLINDNLEMLKRLQSDLDGNLPPVVFLTASRGDIDVANACEEYHAAGGVARMLFKPAGPAKLESLVDFCLQCLERKEAGEPLDPSQTKPTTPLPSPGADFDRTPAGPDDDYFARRTSRPDIRYSTGHDVGSFNSAASTTPRAEKIQQTKAAAQEKDLLGERRPSYHMSPEPPSSSNSLLRRHSTEARMEVASGEDQTVLAARPDRPLLPARSITYHEPRLHKHVLMSPSALRSPRRDLEVDSYFDRPASTQPDTPGSTISLEGGDGAVLKSAVSGGGRGSISGASSETATPKKALRILSVEDNSINRKVIAAYLNKMGISFVEATNGQEGIEEFEAAPAHHFDVILMDLSMPVLDGISAIAAIRKIEKERNRSSGDFGPSKAGRSGALSHKSKSADKHHAKIFALTGRSMDEDKRKAFKTGADGYIVKPLSFKVLSSLLRMLNP